MNFFNVNDYLIRVLKIYKYVCVVSLMLFFTNLTVNAQEQAEVLVLRLGDVSANKFPFVLAYDAGIYQKNGINVVPKFSQSAVNTIRRSGVHVPDEFVLKDDDSEPYTIAKSGSSPMIVRLSTTAGSRDSIILGSTHSRASWRVITGPDITSPEQLKGKRIGYSSHGTVTHLYALQFVKQMGWDPQFDVSLMANGLGMDSLVNGEIDAMIGDDLHGNMAIANDFKVLVELSKYNFPIAGSAMVADREWYKNNPVAARAFVKSAIDAVALMKNDKAATFRTLAKWYGMTDPQILEDYYVELMKLDSKPYPPVEGIKKVMELFDSHEMRKYTPEYFYDDSIVREFDESGYIDSLYKK